MRTFSFQSLPPLVRQLLGAGIGMVVAVGLYGLGKLLPFDLSLPLPGDSAAHAAWEPKTLDDIAEMAKAQLSEDQR